MTQAERKAERSLKVAAVWYAVSLAASLSICTLSVIKALVGVL